MYAKKRIDVDTLILSGPWDARTTLYRKGFATVTRIGDFKIGLRVWNRAGEVYQVVGMQNLTGYGRRKIVLRQLAERFDHE